jgi:dynein heavy chain
VLSVISGQIRIIQAAFKAGVRQFVFEGKKIPLNAGFGIFITMNPGYAGRSELPDNLKAMFRPVVMVVPDKELICEVMLFSEGFETNTHMLAKKIITIYDMAAGQLSKQHHYDWGLRALKSVLTRAGELKRSNTALREEVVLMTALRDMNMPKFTFDDAPLFVGLLNDLFPDVELDPIHDPHLSEQVDNIFTELGHSKVLKQMDKVIQLHETMNARHTTMVVGHTGGGKSVVVNVLAKAQTRLGQLTRLYTINPKACSLLELYGVLNTSTRDWKYGLFSKIFSDINQPTDRKEARYIVFDGDVDAVWVENMNSVMDDNKLLTLANSERIRLLGHCALLFEVGNLMYASPATVSRCGMVFMDPRNLGYIPFYERRNRLNKRGETPIISRLFKRYVTACANFIVGKVSDTILQQPLDTIIPVTPLNMTRQLCCLLEALLPSDSKIKDPEILESIFIFAIIWSFGGQLTDDSMQKFDKFVKNLSNWVIIDAPGRFAKAGQLPGTYPTLYDFEFNIEQAQWIPWP